MIMSLLTMAKSQSTATVDGLVAATGYPSSSIVYSISGDSLSGTTFPTATATTFSATGYVNAQDSNTHGISIGALIAIMVAIVMATAIVIIASILVYRRQSLSVSQRERKKIMDAEFGDVKSTTQQYAESISSSTTSELAKPLPPLKDSDKPCVSHSSTVIAVDAAEVARISRKSSHHHSKSKDKEERKKQRARNHALQKLVTNESDALKEVAAADSMSRAAAVEARHPESQASSNRSPLPGDDCPDGDGDAFKYRPSKI